MTKANKSHHFNQGRKQNEKHTIGTAETLSKNGYAMLEGPLVQLAEFCANQVEEEC
jgi:hypothetical protein